MKKLFNRLSLSGKIESDTLREDTYSDEEHLDTHYRKKESLPADSKDTSQDLKLKKSFSGGSGGSVGRSNKDYDFAKKKSSSSGIKKQKDKDTKENKDNEKLNESDDKALKKSSSLRKKSSKSYEGKNEMKSPALKSVFVSEYEHTRDGSVESGESDDDVPHSHNDSLHDDDFYTTTPIRVPSAPARLASSPIALPPKSPSPSAAASAASPRMDSPPSFTASPPQKAFSPQAQYGMSPSAQLPRSVSSPNPAAHSPKIVADDFDLRFGAHGHARTDSISDDYEKLGNFARDRTDSVADEEAEIIPDEEMSNQKGKSGRFTFGNKAKKLK
jgi:hypothetical protein